MSKKSYVVFIMFFLASISFTSPLLSITADYTHSQLSPTSSLATPQITNIVSENQEVQIRYPLPSLPIIVETESNFTLVFETSDFDEIYVMISTAYEPVIDTFWLPVLNVSYDGELWSALISIPALIPEELYNVSLFIVSNYKMYSSYQPRAVKVIEAFTDTFSFVHITDFHVGDPRGIKENLWQTIGMKSIKKCISEINLLNPDFVIISGDLVYGQIYPYEYRREYRLCYQLIQRFDVPTYLCPGNHDGYRRILEDGFTFWEHYFGPLYYSFNFGNYHFLSVNSYDHSPLGRLTILFAPLNWGGSIRDKQLQWIENDLQNDDSELTFMFMHHNPLWDTQKDSLIRKSYVNRENLLTLINQYDVDMVLAGHTHKDNVTIQNDTVFITTTTPESDIRVADGYWGYRMIQIKNGSIDSYNYKPPKYSIPSYRLNFSNKKPTEAIVENDLEQNLSVLVKFHVPLGEYFVDYGEIVQIRQNNDMQEIYVNAQIPAESLIHINLIQENYSTHS